MRADENLPLFDSIIDDPFLIVLTPIANYVNLCIQRYETKYVRYALIILGQPWSGKSSVVDVLAGGQTTLYEREIEPFHPVHHQDTLNSKAVTIGQLCGVFEELTHKWSNGILARLVEECTLDEMDDQYLIVCHCPVDAF